MLDLRHEEGDYYSGYSLVILWIFCITLTYGVNKGDHVHLSFGLGPLQVGVSMTIWRQLLP